MGAFGVSQVKVKREVNNCQNSRVRASRQKQNWLDLLKRQNWGAQIERQCEIQICDEIKECEAIFNNMCALMTSFDGGRGNQVTIKRNMAALDKAVDTKIKNKRTACEQIVQISNTRYRYQPNQRTAVKAPAPNVGNLLGGSNPLSSITGGGNPLSSITGGGNPLGGLMNGGGFGDLLSGGGLPDIGSLGGLLGGGRRRRK
jgi:hypothetical protein